MYGYIGYTKEDIKEKLSTDEKWIIEALKLLYSYQTREERQEDSTNEQNGKGFNYEDAPILSSYAGWVLTGRSLPPIKLDEAKKRLPKYWKQILSFIQANPDDRTFR